MRLVRGELPEAIKSGQPFIAFVADGTEGHAVLVQEVRMVEGVRHLLVRDPAAGAYRERIADFDSRLVRDKNVLGHPTVWGER